MQVATLSYQYKPKDNFHTKSKSNVHQRLRLTNVKVSRKKSQLDRSFLSDQSTNSNRTLPAIIPKNSIHIHGNGLQQARKLNDVSISSFNRPRSRQSNKSTNLGLTSRTITPSGSAQGAHLKFGHPIKLRSSEFYEINLSDDEVNLREKCFVNDSIRTATENVRPTSKRSNYEPLNDPNLKYYFRSPVVLDVIKKTLSIDLNESLSHKKSRSKRNDQDYYSYHRITAKQSSGYGKLNGYDCIPSFSPARHSRTIKHEQAPSSASTLFTNVPVYNNNNNNNTQGQKKYKSRYNKKGKKLSPIDTSSPVRLPTAATNVTAVTISVSDD